MDPIQASWREKGYLGPSGDLVQQMFPGHGAWGCPGRREPLTEIQSSRSTSSEMVKQQNKATVRQTPGVLGAVQREMDREGVWGHPVSRQEAEV